MSRVDLFGPVPRKPRAKPLKRMRARGPDAVGCVQFVCPHCGHETDWSEDEWSTNDIRRGVPCPVCNEGEG